MTNQLDHAARESLRAKALQLGFVHAGVAPASDADTFPALESWLDEGMHGEMGYMARRREARRHPKSLLNEVRSVWMLAWDSSHGFQSPLQSQQPGEYEPQGRIGRYAWGRDYHKTLKEKLGELAIWCHKEWPQMRTRGVVDTAPLLERDFAQRAGLGWIGKNTLLIDPRQGSHLLLAGFLASTTFPPDKPLVADHCGSCSACLDACPTGALIAPRRLDARRCISYLTLETKGVLPADTPLRQQVGEWLLGCDICQDVCPWNKKRARNIPLKTETSLVSGPVGSPAMPLIRSLDPFWILAASSAEIASVMEERAWERAGEWGLRRNAILVLVHFARKSWEEKRDSRLGQRVKLALEPWLDCGDPGVSDAAEWGLGQVGRLGGLTKD